MFCLRSRLMCFFTKSIRLLKSALFKKTALFIVTSGIVCALPMPVLADTLAEIYELALENDPQLKVAQAQYKSDLEIEKLGRAPLLPQVNANYGFSRNDVKGSAPGFDFATRSNTNSSPTFEDVDNKALKISLQQSLFDLPAWFSFKQGKELSAVATAQFAADQQDVIIRVAEAYFNVLRAKEDFDTLVAEEAAISRQLEQTEQRFEVGLIAITDVYEARAASDLAKVNRLDAEGQLAIAYQSLTVITGQVHSNLWLLSEKFPVLDPVPATRAEWVDFALEGNYPLQVARLSEVAAYHNASAKKWRHLPKLTGSYSYNDSSLEGSSLSTFSSQAQLVDSESHGSTIALSLDIPLFSGGGVSASRRQAYQDYNRSRENSILTQRNTIQNTRSLHLHVLTDVGKVKARLQSITSAESALEATQAGYEVGTRNIVDVLNSQRFRYRSLRDYANVRYDYVLNGLRLKQQAGLLSPQDVYDLNKWLEQPPAPTANNAPAT